MGQGSQVLGDQPVAIEPWGIPGQAPERKQDPNAIALALAMRILPE